MNQPIDLKDLQLNALLGITQAINNNTKEDELFRIYKYSLMMDVNITKIALFVNEDNHWNCRVNFGTNKKYENTTLPEKYKKTLNDTLISDVYFEEFSYIFPIKHKENILAFFLLETNKKLSNLEFLVTLTNITLVAIQNKKLARKELEQNAYKKELEIAKKIQSYLFPKALPENKKIHIKSTYIPNHLIGGDYYDYIKINENRILCCIADASGKGMPAALLMSNFQACLRTLTRQTDNLENIIHELNLTTYTNGNAEHLITFFLAIYDFDSHTLEYANCGHGHALIINNQKIQLLNQGTTVLGMFNPLPFLKTKKISPIHDFFLFACTDGVTDTMNPKEKMFGFERIQKIMKETPKNQLDEINNIVLNKLNEFKQNQEFNDDVTMIACRVNNN